VTAAVTIVAVVAMTSVALAGVVAPYRRRTVPALEALADPLEDRRVALAIALDDLETARDAGAVDGDDYRRLREDTERRIGRVDRALEERRRQESDPAAGPRPTVPPRTARYVAIAVIVVTALSVGLVPSLLRSLHQRGGAGGILTAENTLSHFQQQVRLHPHDVAARLNLGHRCQELGQFGCAFRQYTAVLSIQPDNVDALANDGLMLFLSGRPAAGLAAEDRALTLDPSEPQALFFKGSILLKGLDRPAQALGYLRAYLRAAPYGSYGPDARTMIHRAEREVARRP
jgi:tetratricopeptide (TPR) repeat protein